MSNSPAAVRGRRRIASAKTGARDPLLRNGYALIVGSGMTSVIGVVFWIVAARRYEPAQIGRNSVAITTISFIGAVSQFSLISALTRFIPRAGRSTGKLVACSYALTMAVAAVLAGAFKVLSVSHLEPGLDFIVHDPWLEASFVIGAALWTVFILEDGVLTGLRRAPVVPLENAGFSILKVALLIPSAGILPGAGVFLAWVVSSAATVVPTNCYIFGWAIPRHHRNARDGDGVTIRQLRKFVVSDYLGSMFWLAATALLPLIILKRSGGAASAYFSARLARRILLLPCELQHRVLARSRSGVRPVEARQRVQTDPGASGKGHRAERGRGRGGWRRRSSASSGAPTRPTERDGALRLLALSAIPYIVIGTAESAYRCSGVPAH